LLNFFFLFVNLNINEQFKLFKNIKLSLFFVLHSNQLKDLLIRSIFAWCDLLNPANHLNVPKIRMELTFDDQQMQFYPSYSAISELLLSVVEKISISLPEVGVSSF
jgi:hypothetical protein